MLLTLILLLHAVQLGIGYSLVRKDIPSGIDKIERAAQNIYPANLELRISNGKLYTNVTEPYVVDAPANWGDMGGKHLLVIDTAGTVDNYPQYDTWVLATRTALVYPDSSRSGRTTSTRQIFYFSELNRSLFIDKMVYTSLLAAAHPFVLKLPQYIDIAVVIGMVLMVLAGGFFWELGVLFGLLFLTMIIWVIARIMQMQLGYKSLFKMGMHGLTWALLAGQLLSALNQSVPYAYPLVFILWMVVVLASLRKS